MSKPTIIKFSKPWQGYGPNEIAGFPKEKADQLIAAGLAEALGKGKAAPAPAGQQGSGSKLAATNAAAAASTGGTIADQDADEDKKP